MRQVLYFIFIFTVLLMSWDIGKQDMAIAASRQTVIPDEAIRLRIIANSDAPDDQWLKRKVRDEIIEAVHPWVKSLDNLEEARTIIKQHLPELQQIVDKTIADNGFSYASPAKVELGVVPFPTKMYGQMVYPAGEYEALRVTLGEGQGQNWWCVLFPPLCFVDMSSGDAIPDPEAKIAKQQGTDGEEIVVRFFFVDMIHKIIHSLKSTIG